MRTQKFYFLLTSLLYLLTACSTSSKLDKTDLGRIEEYRILPLLKKDELKVVEAQKYQSNSREDINTPFPLSEQINERIKHLIVEQSEVVESCLEQEFNSIFSIFANRIVALSPLCDYQTASKIAADRYKLVKLIYETGAYSAKSENLARLFGIKVGLLYIKKNSKKLSSKYQLPSNADIDEFVNKINISIDQFRSKSKSDYKRREFKNLEPFYESNCVNLEVLKVTYSKGYICAENSYKKAEKYFKLGFAQAAAALYIYDNLEELDLIAGFEYELFLKE